MASVRRRQKHNPVSLPQSIASAFLWSLLSNLQFPRPGLNLLLMSISKDSPLTPSVSSYRVLKSTGNLPRLFYSQLPPGQRGKESLEVRGQRTGAGRMGEEVDGSVYGIDQKEPFVPGNWQILLVR